MMGSATVSGPDRAVEAVRAAISSPLLEDVDIHGAKGVLVNVSAGPDMELDEFAQVGEDHQRVCVGGRNCSHRNCARPR